MLAALRLNPFFIRSIVETGLPERFEPQLMS